MTVKELKEKLAEYSDEMRVKLAVGWNMDSLDVGVKNSFAPRKIRTTAAS